MRLCSEKWRLLKLLTIWNNSIVLLFRQTMLIDMVEKRRSRIRGKLRPLHILPLESLHLLHLVLGELVVATVHQHQVLGLLEVQLLKAQGLEGVRPALLLNYAIFVARFALIHYNQIVIKNRIY